MTAVFLPDFVGYPLCYLRLQAEAGDSAIFVDYNRYWPYPSVATLAAAIAADLPADVRTIVGYSFGAHVAILLAGLVGDTPEVVLIDPIATAALPARTPAAVEALLRERADYAYVFDAVDAGLTDLDCVVTNVALLAALPARSCPRGAMFVAGGLAAAQAVLAELDGDRTCLEIHCAAGCDHRSILAHPVVEARLQALAR
jgi:pimeloyl-ACP methyl ester carboxylesterase